MEQHVSVSNTESATTEEASASQASMEQHVSVSNTESATVEEAPASQASAVRVPLVLASVLLALVALFEAARAAAAVTLQSYPALPWAIGAAQIAVVAVTAWLFLRQLLLRQREELQRQQVQRAAEIQQLEQRLATMEADLARVNDVAALHADALQAQIAGRDAELDGWRTLAAMAARGVEAPEEHAKLLMALSAVAGAEAGALALTDAPAVVMSPGVAQPVAEVLRQAAAEGAAGSVGGIALEGRPEASITTIALGAEGRAGITAVLLWAGEPSAERRRRATLAANLAALALGGARRPAEDTTPSGADEAAPAARANERPMFVAASGESLYDLLLQRRLQQSEGLRYLRALAETLSPFHRRDEPFLLHPDSALVNPGRGEIYLRQRLITRQTADFGAEYFEGFSAPEQLRGEVSTASDVFALGAYLFLLLTGRRLPAGRGLELALEHLSIAEGPLGIEYLLRKSLWPQQAHRLADASAFLRLLDAIEARQWPVADGLRAPAFDIGAELHVGLNKGRYRGANVRDLEDRLFWDYDTQRGRLLFAVADGVSRATIGSGSVAAQTVAEVAAQMWQELQGAKRGFDTEVELRRLLERANRSVVERFAPEVEAWSGRERPEPMSAAVCLALGDREQITIANLGDVHAFLVAPDLVARITKPHTTVAEALVDLTLPNEGLGNLSGSALTQTVGAWRRDKGKGICPAEIKPAFARLTLRVGESLVLASDGLYGFARDAGAPFEETLQMVLESTPEAQRAAFRLMTLANNRGGGDNIACIVCRAVAEGGL